MIKVKEDLTGKKFSYLTVIKRDEDHVTKSGNIYPRWICKCECGKHVSVFQSSLKSGQQKSCGCKHFSACKKYNNYKVNGNFVEVNLTNCDETMICDLEKWRQLKKYCWIKGKTGYAEARVEGKTRLFHHFVIECEKGKVRDHINRNKLDNRKINLRCVSYSDNNKNVDKAGRNRYGVTGAYKNGNKIGMRIYVNGKIKYIGSFSTIEEAIEAKKKSEELYEGVISP